MKRVIDIKKHRIAFFRNGKRHRINGPAIIYENNRGEEWYKNGKRHRTNNPAIIFPDGSKEWFKNDIYICREQKN